MKHLPDPWRSTNLFPRMRSPLRELQSMQRQIDLLFEDFAHTTHMDTAFTVNCDVEETDSHYLMSFDLPGMKKENIKVEIKGDVLSVSGERKEEKECNKSNYHRNERFYGSFERSFQLPQNVKSEQIEATYTDGVLKLTVPRVEASKAQQIRIADGKSADWIKSKSLPIQEKTSTTAHKAS